ncbi:hypothetical protein BN135_2607 [Cronobacter muytjensii 530]
MRVICPSGPVTAVQLPLLDATIIFDRINRLLPFFCSGLYYWQV